MGLRLRDRLRLLRADYGIVILVACLLAVGAGGWLLYAAQPGTETETVVTDRWNEQGRFTHAAEVTQPNPVFETGTTLERTVYYSSVSPELEGTYVYEHGDEIDRQVTMDLRLVIQSAREDSVLWRRVDPLNTTERTVAAGETIAGEWAVNVSAAAARVERIREQLGASVGTVEIRVVAEVTTNAEDGQPTRHTRSFGIDPNGETFSVTPPEAYGETYETTAERTVETGVTLSLAGAGTGLLIAGLAGTVVLGTTRARDGFELSAPERERIAYERERVAFDEWITVGEVPERLADRPSVEVERLEGLVDVAIDTDERVVEDPERNTLWVQTPTVTYRYEPPVSTTAESTAGATDDPTTDETPSVTETLLGTVAGNNGAADDTQGETSSADGRTSTDGATAESPEDTSADETDSSDGRDRLPD